MAVRQATRRDKPSRKQAEATQGRQSNFVDSMAEDRCQPTAARNEDSKLALYSGAARFSMPPLSLESLLDHRKTSRGGIRDDNSR